MSRLPIKADLRPQFAKWGLPLKAQGARGTCSVFAVTAAIEYAAAERHEAGFIMSEEYLNWASNDAIDEYEDGGFFSDLWKGYQKHGICESRLAPYLSAFDKEWEPSRAARRQAHDFRSDQYELYWVKRWDVNTGLSDEELETILRTLRSGTPVCAGLRWPKDPAWTDGVLQMCPAEDVFDGHSILLVGYGLDQVDPPSGTLVFKDSGQGGRYASMTIEYARAYTNDAAFIGD